MTELRPIRTPEEHRAALAQIDQLMDAAEGSPEATELEVLAILVERYERGAFPIEVPSPIPETSIRA